MRRSNGKLQARATRQLIQRETQTAAAKAAGSADPGTQAVVGGNDPTTEDWFGYGLLDITTFGGPFYLA